MANIVGSKGIEGRPDNRRREHVMRLYVRWPDDSWLPFDLVHASVESLALPSRIDASECNSGSFFFFRDNHIVVSVHIKAEGVLELTGAERPISVIGRAMDASSRRGMRNELERQAIEGGVGEASAAPRLCAPTGHN